jgi:Lrp/AsnC family transcriptional regulator for asnA, asnC and gidA
MLNDIDIKLINELQKDGRRSNRALARSLGIHASTVSRRMSELIDSGTISIRALPNLNKLGYHAQALLAIDADISKIDEICELLYGNFHVNTLLTIFGRYNLLVTVHYFNWNELLNFVSVELSRMEGVKRVETHLMNEIIKRYYGVFDDSSTVMEIDETDQKIIERLTENGRYTARFLASDIGISLPTCLRRINFLLQNNLITIRALINPTKVGFVANAIILLHVEPDQIESVCSILCPLDYVVFVYTLFSGSHNVVFGIHRKTPEELFGAVKSVLSKVSIISRIADTEIFIRSEIKKRYYGGFWDLGNNQ